MQITTDLQSHPVSESRSGARRIVPLLVGLGLLPVLTILIWQGVTAHGNPDPTTPNTSPLAAILDIAVLVFREGLESILVLAAITAGLSRKSDQRVSSLPIFVGASAGFLATLATWYFVRGIIIDISVYVPMLALQAATGLLAVIVLLIVMNWFFHKVYWGGWISLHHRRKKELLNAPQNRTSPGILFWGLVLLGLSSVYREGFEVVLFLQSYYLKLGGFPVLEGSLFGLVLTLIVAVITFWAHHRLPYRKMLIFTGIMLGFVLLVMVGEEAFEMQQALWIPTTTIHALESRIPDWAGVWFSLYPNVQTIAAQLVAALLVVGSYFISGRVLHAHPAAEETSAS
jgi:high-affinity iron transporter